MKITAMCLTLDIIINHYKKKHTYPYIVFKYIVFKWNTQLVFLSKFSYLLNKT